MVVTLGQQYNAGEKHTVMLLVIGKEKIFTLYNESTEIFYDVYSETVVQRNCCTARLLFHRLNIAHSSHSWCFRYQLEKLLYTVAKSALQSTVVQYSTL